jgi:hypothetical protein
MNSLSEKVGAQGHQAVLFVSFQFLNRLADCHETWYEMYATPTSHFFNFYDQRQDQQQ